MANSPVSTSGYFSRRTILRLLVFAALAVIAGLAVARAVRPPHPPALVEFDSVPVNAKRVGNTWAWLEKLPGKEARLLIEDDGRVTELARSVSDFDAAGDDMVWSSGTPGKWEVLIRRSGREPLALYRGSNEPVGFHIADGRVYWLEKVPGSDPSSPLPPLADSLALRSVGTDGGEAERITVVFESEPGQVLGIRDSEVLFSAYRPGFPGATAIYSAPTDHTPAQRLVGDSGRNSAVMTRSGDLFWSAPSRESSEPSVDSCIRGMGRDGKVRTLAEWLAPGGQMYRSGSRAFYIDGEMNPMAWPAESAAGLPRSHPIPAGYGAAAISDSRLLLVRRLKSGRVTLHEVSLP